jgi:signal transduction histidine kinase
MNTRLDELPCGLAAVGPDGRVRQASAGLGRLMGTPAAALRGRSFDSLLAPAAAVLYQSYLLPLLHLHGQVEEFELTLRQAQGQRVSVLFYGTRQSEGAEGGAVIDVVLVPVRERRRVQDELLRVKRAAELAPGMMFQLVLPPAGPLGFTYVSDAVRGLYGTTAEDAAQTAEVVLNSFHPEDVRRLRARLHPGASLEPWVELLRVPRADAAPAWHEIQATPQRRSDGTWVWHGFIADVTQRELQSQALAEREAQERQMRERSEFLARVSHEFRTPLNAIIGFSQLLTRPGAPALSPEQARQLATINAAGSSLLHLVNDVLAVTALDSGQATLHLLPLPLRPLLEEALTLVSPQATEAGVALQPLVCDAALQVLADRQRLGQVLNNLLSNAVKYNRPGGSVSLTAKPGAGMLCVTVADTGPGLTAAQVAQLFQPFNRLGAERSGRPGTGLGLVITRNLAALMGGRVQVDSEPGQGSRFSVLLPPAPAGLPAAASDAGTGVDSAAVSGGERSPAPRCFDVLYVEDDEVNRVLMQAVLALRPSVRLRLAADGASALAQALAQPPQLLLVDLHLPDINGFDLVRQLRRHDALAQVPAVLVSAAVGPEQQQTAADLGLAGCWSKPLDLAQTLASLDTMLAPVAPAR